MNETKQSKNILEKNFPYPSYRLVSYGDACVATSQAQAAQAGLAILTAGGNAVDAALATAITLTIVEPTKNGIGGDLFCMVHDGKTLHGLNSSGRSPAGWSADHFAGHATMPEYGWHSITVPGQIAGWAALHERFGSVAWGDLFEAGIGYARDGFLVPDFIAKSWQSQAVGLSKFDGFRSTFMPGGRAPKAGERFRNPEAAETLAILAKDGADAFYHGELGARVTAYAADNDGLLTAADLANHTSEWVTPLSTRYQGTDVHELPPNGQGIAALIALGALERLPCGSDYPDDPEALLQQIEAMRQARQLVSEHVADPSFMRLDPAELLSPVRLDEIASSLRNPVFAAAGDPQLTGSDTVYLAAADRSGLMVSLIQSNYHGFGSGIVVPGTGISLHNRGCGFVTDPNHVNAVGPNKRPFNTIIPGFLTRNDRPLAAFGVMGGSMQPQGHLQIVTRMIGYGQNAQAAIDAPRWRLDGDHTLLVEDGIPEETAQYLTDFGYDVSYPPPWSESFGAAQTIWKLDDGYAAGTESRRDGIVAAV